MALAGRGVDVDALSAGAAHGGLGAGQDPVAEAAPLAVGMHGDPVEVVAGDRPGNRAVAGIAEQAAVLLQRSEEHTSELQSLMRISYAVFCLKKKKHNNTYRNNTTQEEKQITTN